MYTSLCVTPPLFSPLKYFSPQALWFPFSSFISRDLQPLWTKAGCPYQGKALFLSLLSTKYKDTFIFTDGSHIPSSLPTNAAIYLPALHTSTNCKLLPHITILGAELFAIKECLNTSTALPPHQPVSLFTDFLTPLQLLSTHRPHTHYTPCFTIHLLLAQQMGPPSVGTLTWQHCGQQRGGPSGQSGTLKSLAYRVATRPQCHTDSPKTDLQQALDHQSDTCRQPRPTLEDLLGSDTLRPNTAFQALKCTKTFLQKSGQLDRI
ncbi:uncharacterized protein LOC127008119 [Eriocheir sinensis]|uniref:uncharacterized protein LOC127008119 n=1 Tax=Eriocheir sinensis TaxID=95602 RepID=UPI0021C6F0EF|nr:uncharacterized protein LOC127008119 [Eriocheir sinensis]